MSSGGEAVAQHFSLTLFLLAVSDHNVTLRAALAIPLLFLACGLRARLVDSRPAWLSDERRCFETGLPERRRRSARRDVAFSGFSFAVVGATGAALGCPAPAELARPLLRHRRPSIPLSLFVSMKKGVVSSSGR